MSRLCLLAQTAAGNSGLRLPVWLYLPLFYRRQGGDMRVGVPSEVKADEYRVGLLPVAVELLVQSGHQVCVQADAGLGSGVSNAAYERAGATISASPADVWGTSEIIVKVKEPQASEYDYLRPDLTLFGYCHFAADRPLTEAAIRSGVSALTFETVRDRHGRLPLLTPMSEVAGKMSVQEGAKYLERPMMGRGILLGGVPGVAPAKVVVLGAGVVGTNAAKVAAGLGADVVVMDIDIDRLRYQSDFLPANVTTIFGDPHSIVEHCLDADLVIGSVLVPGDRAPHLIDHALVRRMQSGAVLVDVCIDQGGCAATGRPTTHADPTYVVDDIVHYCVGNIPGAVARTSSLALGNALLPYVRQLADYGRDGFLAISPGHQQAANIMHGAITHPGLAHAFPDLPCTDGA